MKDIFRLVRYAKPFPIFLSIAIFTMVIQVFASFFIPFLIIDIIDVYLPARDFDALINTALLMLGVAFIGIIAGIVNTYTSQYISQYASADLRLDLYRKIQSLSFKNVDDFKQSRLITNATNDVLRVQMFFTMMLRIVIRAPLMVLIGLILALRTSFLLSQVFYVTIPLLIISILIIMVFAYPRFKRVQYALDDLNNTVLETASAPQVIKSFVSQAYEKDRFERDNEQYRNANTSAETVMAFAEPVIQFIFNMGIAGILFVAAYYLDQGLLMTNGLPQVGVIMAFQNYSMQILVGLMMFAMIMIFLSRANVSAARINEIFDTRVDLENPENGKQPEIHGAIAFENVSFAYGKESNRAVSDLTFTIEAGEKIGLIGSTGSGKSTLTYLIPRLYDVISGHVRIDGHDVRSMDLPYLRDKIGYVTQNATIFSGSIATNIRQGEASADYEMLEKSAQEALLDDFIDNQEDGFNYLVRSKGSNLSGGQKQRLSIARAMVKRPPILILDDATSAVDAQSEQKILNHINALDYNPTLLLISQKVSTVRKLDRILVLDNDGRIDGFDTHEVLMESSPTYREIAQSQLGNGGGYDVK